MSSLSPQTTYRACWSPLYLDSWMMPLEKSGGAVEKIMEYTNP